MLLPLIGEGWEGECPARAFSLFQTRAIQNVERKKYYYHNPEFGKIICLLYN